MLKPIKQTENTTLELWKRNNPPPRKKAKKKQKTNKQDKNKETKTKKPKTNKQTNDNRTLSILLWWKALIWTSTNRRNKNYVIVYFFFFYLFSFFIYIYYFIIIIILIFSLRCSYILSSPNFCMKGQRGMPTLIILLKWSTLAGLGNAIYEAHNTSDTIMRPAWFGWVACFIPSLLQPQNQTILGDLNQNTVVICRKGSHLPCEMSRE